MRVRGWLVGLASMGVVVALGASCSDGGASSGAAGVGGEPGSVGGAGGGGAAGSPGLCDRDCSQVEPPPCHEVKCNHGGLPGPPGSCVLVPLEDGAACDDGKFCTTGDRCQDGSCIGGTQNDCGIAAKECELVSCSETSRSCHAVLAADGEPCEHEDPCLVGSFCQGGVCIGGTPKQCDFEPVPNECHVAECNPQTGMCEAVAGNEGEPCTDPSDLCTVGKTCKGGDCQGGAPKDCSHLTDGCVLGVCDSTTGQCVTQPVGEGMACDDLDGCTIGETCQMGSCTGGTPVTSCNDDDDCCPTGCDATNDTDCAKEEYSHGFPNGSVSYSSPQCQDWAAFVSKLTGSFTEVTIRGSQDPIGVSCTDASKATAICNALETSTTLTGVSCDGRTWNVSECSGQQGQPYEINSGAASGACTCEYPGYTVRPCIGNSNWGGVDTATCGSPAQTMEVICHR